MAAKVKLRDPWFAKVLGLPCRLQGSRTHKFVHHFVLFLATFIVKHGPVLTSATLDKVQPGILLMLLQQVG